MNFIDSVLQDHYQELELEKYGIGRHWATVLLTPRFVTSRHVVALIFAIGAREPSLVVKVPRQPGDNHSVRHEAEMMKQLRARGGRPLIGVPEVLGTLDVGAHTVLIETAVTGAPLDPHRVAADLSGAISAGTDFVAALPFTRSAPANEGWYDRTISRPLRALAGMLPLDDDLSVLVERTHEMLAPLRSVQLPAVVEHGDLSHPNLFLPPQGRLQVVDWERSRTDGLPGHDLVFYLQYLSESNEQAFSRIGQLEAFDKAFGSTGWALAPLRSHLQLRGVNPDLLPLLITATWARSAATLAYRLAGQAAPEQGRTQMRAAVLADRDYWLWRHVVNTWSMS
ncbi:aminoglycoside phosphotransferase family protein [Pseudarthrobacter sp. N5]|uniref:aminoglycoside phosphotransferase family protein n=1 Tax=Pseudarthrobacter sp. N5 TaxID=3418416 RepID=UPI003CF2084A